MPTIPAGEASRVATGVTVAEGAPAGAVVAALLVPAEAAAADVELALTNVPSE